MLPDATLEAVVKHRRDVHHACQPDSLRHRGRPRLPARRTTKCYRLLQINVGPVPHSLSLFRLL
jgi:hypothetical protein